MAANLFELALDQMESSDWNLLEKLASKFLAVDFPNLRTMANPDGDQGRDSELFCADGDPTVCFQYSVSLDWATKINRTHKRLNTTFPNVRLLVYATNQPIGAKGDDLRKTLLKENRFLDIRDKSWFLERQFTHVARQAAAAELIERIALPFIHEYDDRKQASSPLPSAEARTALTYLTLQLHDDQHGKGLTKVCFDALVRSALRDSSSNQPVSRNDVHRRVLEALPSADKETTIPFVDASLSRLKKRILTHHSKSDTFFLRHDESTRIQNRIADAALVDVHFKRHIAELCIEFLSQTGTADPNDVADLQTRIPRIIEALCLSAGEQFVAAVSSGRTDGIRTDQLHDAVFTDLNKYKYTSPKVTQYPSLIQHVIRAIAISEHEPTRAFLRGISTSYTLLAFLNQTPDVQKATRRIFSHGKIWIDTTAILPLFAEQLFDEAGAPRVYETIYSACRHEGDELFVTRGVINEIHHHMLRCVSCMSSRTTWQGHTPYLLAQFIKRGRGLAGFRDWLGTFRGDADPEADLEIYLKEEHGIYVKDLSDGVARVDDEVRFAVDRLWGEAHEKRRSTQDQFATDQLRVHDVEMYLGVMGLRSVNVTPELGARAWLLTRDTTAWSLRNALRAEFPELDVRSPLLSMSFLINAITFSPSRTSLTHALEVRLPTILDLEFQEADPTGFLEIAEAKRLASAGLPERVIQRMVREALTDARRRAWQQVSPSEADGSEPSEDV